MSDLATRLRTALERRPSMSVAEFARQVGVRPPSVFQWLSGASKTMKAESSRRAAAVLGCRREWLETGRGDAGWQEPAVTPNWGAPFGGAQQGGSLAQDLSHPPLMIEPETVTWDSIKMREDLPSRFVLAMPDDALHPTTPRGTRLIFVSGDTPPSFGVGVLVEDAEGQRHVRRYTQATGAGWVAEARHDAYRNLASDDGAKIIAWVEARYDGAV